MTSVQSKSEHKLTVRRTLAASRERVFTAWTDATSLNRWCAPKGMSAQDVELDLRVGGAFRLPMQGEDGEVLAAVGTYREVRPPEKLVFTWRWEGDDEFPDTLVTLEFLDRDGATELVLTHERLPSVESRDNHESGWIDILERLSSEY